MGNEAHIGTAHRFADRFGICGVVLVRLDVRFDELRGHQLYGMPERFQLPRPVMRAAARFHADQAGWQGGEKRRYLLALERLPEHGLASFIHAMYLEHVLCQIDTNCRNLHLGRLSYLLVEISHLHFGTQMPFREGATIPLVGLSACALPNML
jgi:hypothetical protein